jgi:hypothetical protein
MRFIQLWRRTQLASFQCRCQCTPFYTVESHIFIVWIVNCFFIFIFNPLNAKLNLICHLLILLGDLTFMGTRIVSIFRCISNKMQRYTVYLYLETALPVSGGTSTHLQERIQLYLQHLVFVTPLLLSAAISEELEPVSKLCNVASCWMYIGILLGAHCILHTSRIRVNYLFSFIFPMNNLRYLQSLVSVISMKTLEP